MNVASIVAFWPILKMQTGSASEHPAIWICRSFAVLPVWCIAELDHCWKRILGGVELQYVPQSWNDTADTMPSRPSR